MTRRIGSTFATGLVLFFVAGNALAQVTEPNGVKVPGPSSTPGETSLQSYFDTLGEKIDAVAMASTDPGVFSPLCNFKATLVLSQSSAAAGLAWYNVPADPMAAPDAIYPIIRVPPGGSLGQTISSADIVSDPNYKKGFIGFVLTKQLNNLPDQRVYYSEYQRNAYCSGCTGTLNGAKQTPGYWKMSLTYPSTVTPNAFYLAFEDWEGANASNWPDDGDFNDKVFKIEGVTCMGGGQPCDTGGMGPCRPGLTECGLGGVLVCKPQVKAGPEKCDNFDNDCDGVIDNGNLCDEGFVCSQGKCVHSCSSGEFVCDPGLVCDKAGHCIDPACANVQCDTGKVCKGGNCVAPCDGVVCPAGQSCDAGSGRCLDPCAGVTCPQTEVCERGVCVAGCGCRVCGAGNECNATSGVCVEAGCGNKTCGARMVCKAPGDCVDPCAGAVCPGGAMCSNGQCGDPIATGGTGGSAAATSSASTFQFTTATTSGTGNATGSGVGGGAGGSGGSTGSGGTKGGHTSCACRAGASDDDVARGAAAIAVGMLAFVSRRRRRRA